VCDGRGDGSGRRRRRRTGCRTKNKNPTQRCGEIKKVPEMAIAPALEGHQFGEPSN